MPSPTFRCCALIPCLDGEATLADVISATRRLVPDVIVVDDGSRDGTAEVARRSGAIVHRHEQNRGKGAALLTGLAVAHDAGYSHVVTLDADGQHNPADGSRLIDAALEAPTAIVVGARDFDVPHVPGGSRFGRNFSNFWVKLWAGKALSDTQSGFRVYPTDLTLRLGVRPSRFQWEVEVLVRAQWAGLEVVDVPISVFYAPPGERVSHYRGFADSTLITLMHFRLLGRWMLRPVWPIRRLLPRP